MGIGTNLTTFRDQVGDLQTAEQNADEMLRFLRDWQIQTDEDQTFAAEFLRETKGLLAEIETRRKTVTQPLNKTIREINSWFTPAKNALQQTEKLLKSKMAQYIAEREAANQRALAEAAAAETGEQTQQALAGLRSNENPDGVYTRSVRKYRIVDETLLPREFLCPDHDALRDYVKGGWTDPIPGVEFYEEKIVVARKK